MTAPKKKPTRAKPRPVRATKAEITPLEWMLSVVNDAKADPARRDRMAASAAQFLHRRLPGGGVKDARAIAAKKVAKTGRFKTGATPKHLRGRDE